ncbi:MAG: glucose-1-phosphate cytidylyltransferase [Clostridia bacterium]|nr:glucose-1-phosphate cytidylyltransferase [Clostridia bacterium]
MNPKVIIFCGGLGTRLKEETEYKPKPMVEVGNKPILWHIMKLYSHYGLKDFVLCLGYKGEKIKEYFLNYEMINNDFRVKLGSNKEITIFKNSDENDWNVTLVDTGKTALKGSRLKKVEKYIDSDIFMVTYGDGVADIDINKLLEFHKSHGKIGTVTGVRPPSLFGELLVENDKALLFSEKPQTSSGLISGGFFVFNKKLFDYLSIDDNCDFEKGPLEKLAAEGELMVYTHTGKWGCMDTQRDMEYLNNLWNMDKAFWKLWDC